MTLTWTRGDECGSVALPRPTGTAVKGSELQVRTPFALAGYNSDDCTRTTTGGLVNGGDFQVPRPYSADDIKLLYPGISQRYMSFRVAG